MITNTIAIVFHILPAKFNNFRQIINTTSIQMHTNINENSQNQSANDHTQIITLRSNDTYDQSSAIFYNLIHCNKSN